MLPGRFAGHSLVCSLTCFQYVAVEDVLFPPSRLEWNEAMVAAAMQALVPENALVFQFSQFLDVTAMTQSEAIYGMGVASGACSSLHSAHECLSIALTVLAPPHFSPVRYQVQHGEHPTSNTLNVGSRRLGP